MNKTNISLSQEENIDRLDQPTRCGSIALLGRPNAGKSTLLNALLGQKVAGVSKKPQTTRNSIMGIVTEGYHQLLILDTPGIHKTEGLARINRMMVKEAYKVLDDACSIAYLVDVVEGMSEQDFQFLGRIRESTEVPIVIYLSQVDKKPKAFIFERLERTKSSLKEAGLEIEVLPLSAKRKEYLAKFKQKMFEFLPLGSFAYPEDELTDKSMRFVVTEMIRETMFRTLGQEIPYHAAVVVEDYKDLPHLARITANIVVSRETQKGMVVGKKGIKIREIGQASRHTIENMLGKKVFLDLHVKVQSRWIDEKSAVMDLLELDPS